MRPLTSWSLRLSVLLSLSLLTPRPASAQFLTTDVPHIGVQLAEFGKKTLEWAKTIQNYAVVKDAFAAAKTANDISGKIKSISDQVRDLTGEGLALQKQIREDLKKVASIRNLKVSNMSDLRNMALNLSNMNMANALPSLGQSKRFSDALNRASTKQDMLDVIDGINVASIERGVRRNAADTRQQATTSAMTQLALENMLQQDKMEQAFRLKKSADELVKASEEMRMVTNTEGSLSMTEGERMSRNADANRMLLEAEGLRRQQGQLMAEASQKGPAQLAAEASLLELHQVAGLNALHHSMHPDQDRDY